MRFEFFRMKSKESSELSKENQMNGVNFANLFLQIDSKILENFLNFKDFKITCLFVNLSPD